jgi:hypothetical protein
MVERPISALTILPEDLAAQGFGKIQKKGKKA